MVRLIDDMLDVTRLRSGALSIQPKPFDLAAMAARVVDSLGQQAEAVGSTITLHAAGPVQGMWDEFRVEQVLTNLLTNALRYGGGKPVRVEVGVAAASAGFAGAAPQAFMTVRDGGMGIATADQERIFEQFERTADSKKHAAGLGLGLYITRQIVRAHGGEISVESQPGAGAVFRVTLPLEVAVAIS